MGTVDQQIASASDVISANIVALGDNRPLLAQNVLSQLRNLVEGIAVGLHSGSGDTEFRYDLVGASMEHVASKGQLNLVSRFHKLLQISASHYTMSGDPSERLMLKYFDFLHRVREVAATEMGLSILRNLDDFPVDLDPSLRDYHERIAARVHAATALSVPSPRKDRYYVHSVRPFYVGGSRYYEVTFYDAVNRVSKFDRLIGFTDIEISDKYAANLALQTDSINVLGQTMPITIIREWEVSIRPCELINFGRIFGREVKLSTTSPEYRRLMEHLTSTSSSLLDIVDMNSSQYSELRAWATERSNTAQLFGLLDEVRKIVDSKSPGHNVIRYLMLRMNNQIIKRQSASDSCHLLSGLRLSYGCNPFELMPFCSSLVGHNPRFSDLVESLDLAGRSHELLARRVKNNVEESGMVYTPVVELERLGDTDKLISAYNQRLYYKHAGRKLVKDKGHVFIKDYEDGVVAIMKRLQDFATSGVAGHATAVQQWLGQAASPPDDPLKSQFLEELFTDSRVALIYGAAGTGKSTMVSLIADYFRYDQKLFLAHTNPAVDNLKRRVDPMNSVFRTISGHVNQMDSSDYEVLVIDECSTVSNSDLLKVLDRTSFKLIVLVGDVFQIESIQFGNWFGLAREFIPKSATFELTTPFRTKNQDLLDLWSTVREIKDDVAETLARNEYSGVLDGSLVDSRGHDEIVLCLNYDGLYGINNVNRFLQMSNPGRSINWGAATYKVGDPVLFNETDRFRPMIYNNLKGKIVDIQVSPGHVQFDVSLDRTVSAAEASSAGLIYVEGSTVRFGVHERGSGDEDDDSTHGVIPFQVAYAVSIHKAQGLEYDSVKVVITGVNEDSISHSVLYTAVTRAREHLKIYWTPETENAVLRGLQRTANSKDVALLKARHGLSPVL